MYILKKSRGGLLFVEKRWKKELGGRRMLLVTTQRLNFSFFKDQSLYLFVVVDIPPPSILMWLVNVQVENRSFTCLTGAFSISEKLSGRRWASLCA